MRRLVVLLVGVVFVAGFGFLTISVVTKEGLTIVSVISAAVSLLVLALVFVAIVGSLRDPP
jgi:hypothetical protein